MEKFFMTDTNDELHFGDHIEVDLTKEMEDGHIKHHHIDCVFCPELVDMLLDAGIIEVEEDEDKEPFTIKIEDDLDEDDYIDKVLKVLVTQIEILNTKVSKLESVVQELNSKENTKKRVRKESSEQRK